MTSRMSNAMTCKDAQTASSQLDEEADRLGAGAFVATADDKADLVCNELSYGYLGGIDRDLIRAQIKNHMLYFAGQFEEARESSSLLVDSPVPAIALVALTTRFACCVQINEPDAAYADFLKACDLVVEGLAQAEDHELYITSFFCAMRLENILAATLFDLPEMPDGLGDIPIGPSAYFGYQHVIRYLRQRRFPEAAGMAYAFLTVADPRFPTARVYLHLASAVSDLASGNPRRAVERFGEAWELKERYGIVAPFVELCSGLMGLPRQYFPSHDTEEFRRMEQLVCRYRRGWHGLRDRCGFTSESESLTELEVYCAGLVCLGWRNKEIAAHLNISENTVKHYLSSVYQKLHVSNRAQMQAFFEDRGASRKYGSQS